MRRTLSSPQTGAGLFVCGVIILLASSGARAAVCDAGAQPAAERSLYERLGGLPAIALIVSDFMDEFVADPLIMANPEVRERKRGDALPFITYQVTTLVCEATGGPCSYTGATLREAHAGLNISPDEWDRMGEIFVRTLERHGVSQRAQQDLLAIIGPTRDDIVVARGER